MRRSRCWPSAPPAAVPGFTVDAENAADVARICFRLDGLPLALELAAARLGALGTATLAERLDDRFRLLRGGSRVGPTRQQTLAATLQWSHDLLADDEKLLLRRLAVFAGGFDLAAAETVCAAMDSTPTPVIDVLARLVEKSLVSAEEIAGRAPLPAARDGAAVCAWSASRGGSNETALTERHARWALAMAEREGDSPQLDREAANLRAAHDALLRARPAEALRYCVALLPFWLRRIDLEEAHRRLTASARRRSRAHRRCAPTALLAASAIDYRAGTLACAEGARAGEPRDRRRARRPARAMACAAAARRDRRRLRRRRRALADLLEAARELAPRGSARPRKRSRSIHSVWPAGCSAIWPRAEALLVESAASFRSLADSAERIQSLLNIAEMRPGDPHGSARSADRLRGDAAAVRRDLLRGGGRLRARKPGHDRASARSAPSAHGDCSTRPTDRFAPGRATSADRRTCSCVAPTSSSAEASPQAARECLEQALRARRRSATAVASAWRLSATRPRRDRQRRLRRWPSADRARPVISSAAPATVGGSSARCGGRRTSRSRAGASTTPRRRLRRRGRSSERPSARMDHRHRRHARGGRAAARRRRARGGTVRAGSRDSIWREAIEAGAARRGGAPAKSRQGSAKATQRRGG